MYDFKNCNTYLTIIHKTELTDSVLKKFYLGDLVRLNLDDLSFLGVVPRSQFAALCPLPDRFAVEPSKIIFKKNYISTSQLFVIQFYK